MDENTPFSQIDKILNMYIRGLLSRSHFTFSQILEPILTPSTVTYLFRRKVTKSTIEQIEGIGESTALKEVTEQIVVTEGILEC